MSPILHDSRRLDSVVGRSIFEYADALSVRVPTSCGRSGECHECIVEIKQGLDTLSPATPSEAFLRGSYRLACQAHVTDPNADLEFAVLRRQPRILTRSVKRPVKLDPVVNRRGDDVYSGDRRLEAYRGQMYGLAVDAGTTTVVMNLVDLESGDVLATASFENPQRFGGSDIMHRISYDGGDHAGELRQVLLSSINFEIGEMSRQLRFHRRRIYDVVVVGNATMRDILFGVDVQSIVDGDYAQVEELADRYNLKVKRHLRRGGVLEVTGGQLDALARDPDVTHVSADSVVRPTMAVTHQAIGADQAEDSFMLVDVGTNTEVVVGNRHGMMAASCPAGPAFEGGEITYGMPGYEGAVESVEIGESGVVYRTIGGVEPQGICGSGLVDLLAELRRTGMMNELGVFADGGDEFTFAPEQGMSVSRADVSALAQAKSANYSGQRIVLRRYGVTPGEISRLYLAGGFANYVDASNAASIGFIADAPPERVEKVGNAALEGATLMLVSRQMREEAERIVRRIEHVELETTPDFFEVFVEGCMFKPMAESEA